MRYTVETGALDRRCVRLEIDDYRDEARSEVVVEIDA
jgi:hypothetical protein